MTHKKLLLVAALVALVGSAAVGGGVYARGGSDDNTASPVATTEETQPTTTTETETENETELTDAQKQEVEAHKSEIKDRLEAKKAEIKEKLADKRLQTCERRQSMINKIFDNATERNKKQLAVFQKIEDKVKAFYVDKKLSVEGYDAAVANADAKKTAAVAAIEASADVNFDCASADGTNPGSVIKEAMQARHTALKDYKTAVKDLIVLVKKGHGQQTDTTKTDTTEGAQ